MRMAVTPMRPIRATPISELANAKTRLTWAVRGTAPTSQASSLQLRITPKGLLASRPMRALFPFVRSAAVAAPSTTWLIPSDGPPAFRWQALLPTRIQPRY